MATWEDLTTIAFELPELTEVKPRDFRVKNKLVAWERPLRRVDLEALGTRAPKGDVLGVWVPSLDAKEGLIATQPTICFTTPHFNGYPIVLVRLGKIPKRFLRELVTDAWRTRAPARTVKAYDATRPRSAPATPAAPRPTRR